MRLNGSALMIPTSVDPIFGLTYPTNPKITHESTSSAFGYRHVQPLAAKTASPLCPLARFGAFNPATALATFTASVIHGAFKTLSWATEVASTEEAKLKRSISYWSNQYVNSACDFLRYPSPYILGAIHQVAKKAEESSLALKLHVASGIEFTHNCQRQVALDPLEMNKILEQIGPQVVSNGLFLETFQTIGSTTSEKLAQVGQSTTTLLQTLSTSQLGPHLQSMLNKTATGLEFLMILPFGPQLLADFLERGGIPVSKLEKLFSRFMNKAPELKINQPSEKITEYGLYALDALNEIVLTKQVDKSSTAGQEIIEAINWGVPMISWLFVSSHTMIVLPFLMQRVLPHLLRSSATSVGQHTQSFLEARANDSDHFFNAAKMEAKRSLDLAGSWLQLQYNATLSKITGSQTIDPLRLQNFAKLTPEVKQHLYELTKLSPATDPAKLLIALDTFSLEQLTQLTPTGFSKLDSATQAKIEALVKKYSKTAANSSKELVTEFNSLSIEKQQELERMTLSDFHALTHASKNELLFLSSPSAAPAA